MERARPNSPQSPDLAALAKQPLVLVPETQPAGPENVIVASSASVAEEIGICNTPRLSDSQPPIGAYIRLGGAKISDRLNMIGRHGDMIGSRRPDVGVDRESEMEGFLRFIQVLPSDFEVRELLKKHCFNSPRCFVERPQITILLLTQIGFPCKVAHDLVVLAPVYCNL